MGAKLSMSTASGACERFPCNTVVVPASVCVAEVAGDVVPLVEAPLDKVLGMKGGGRGGRPFPSYLSRHSHNESCTMLKNILVAMRR